MTLAGCLIIGYLIGLAVVWAGYITLRREDQSWAVEKEPVWITIRDGFIVSLFWPVYVLFITLAVL